MGNSVTRARVRRHRLLVEAIAAIQGNEVSTHPLAFEREARALERELASRGLEVADIGGQRADDDGAHRITDQGGIIDRTPPAPRVSFAMLARTAADVVMDALCDSHALSRAETVERIRVALADEEWRVVKTGADGIRYGRRAHVAIFDEWTAPAQQTEVVDDAQP